MPGNLPGSRPVSADYGNDMVDRTPVKDPDRQTGAATWNDLKADVAFMARLTPLLRLRVTNNGATATITDIQGPEGISAGDVSVSRLGAGLVRVAFTGLGIAASMFVPVARHATAHRLAGVYGQATDACSVFAVNAGDMSAVDVDFDLLVY